MITEFSRLRWLRRGVFALLLFIILSSLGLVILDRIYPLDLPDNNKLFARVVVDEHDMLLRAFSDEDGVWRYPISLSEVSPLYIDALLTYEDRWFWFHPGVNPLAIVRASLQNMRSGRVISGGSTITMQVARILYPHERSMWGKAQQVLRAFQLEWHLQKEEILQLYLNIAPFGGTIEGVQAASYTYLDKPAKKLTHAEAALLAVLPQAPTRYRPDRHPQVAQKARDKVLRRMANLGVWSPEIVSDAMLEQVFSFDYEPSLLAPLLSRRLLSDGSEQSVIKTTLDGYLQQSLQEMLGSFVHRMTDQSSAAVLVVDNRTSAVKAYVGTAEFASDARYGYVDMIRARRSPGSTLKPFLYGLAIDEGLIHSKSLLADVPRNWGAYRPGNFSGSFSGPVSADVALQRSLNMPAVDLLERYGVKRFAAKLANAGLDLSIPDEQPNLSVILGGAGASLEQLVLTYIALANEGKTSKLKYLQSELEHPKEERPLLSPSSAWVIHQIMSGIDRPDSIRAVASSRHRKPIAWKTGTSYGFRDSWAIGVSPDYTIGVWVGRPDGTAIPGYYGRATAGPLLFQVVDQLDLKQVSLPQPPNVSQESICWPLGIRESEQSPAYCQKQMTAWVVDDVVPPTWHAADSDAWQTRLFTYWMNPTNGLRVSMDCTVEKKEERQVALWPKVLEPWIQSAARRAALIPSVDPQCSNTSIPASATLKITGIQSNNIYRKSGNSGRFPAIWLKAIGGQGKRSWYIDGHFLAETNPEQVVEYELKSLGQHQLSVKDELGNVDVVRFEVQ